MRLLNTRTFEVHEFFANDIPKYAVLSHVWAREEVSLQDLQAGRGPFMQGYEKIVLTCNQARHDSLDWAWVDTCCIDKTSSTELSEAINSMYRWYQMSDVCYAYLADVDAQFPYATTWYGQRCTRQVSRWFTRAWTLQELLAPRHVVFYGRGWRKIGNRTERWISQPMSTVTGIPLEVMLHPVDLSRYSVAQKMSWAAHRSSTRPEDRAYSLLGLFDINMPLLYGEGDKAFVRLQEEILKETDDHSLLCWTVPRSSPRAWTPESVFARNPDDFARSGNIVDLRLYDHGFPSTMTNRGLEMRLDVAEREYGKKILHI